MRLVARHAALQADRRVLVGEGPGLVAMALEAARLVGADGLDGARQEAAVRVVAVHAGHGAFRQPVLVRPLEAGPHVRVAPGAQLVDVRLFARHQPVGPVLVDGVAGDAAHLVPGMTAVDASHVRGLIQMAGEADLVRFGGLELARIADIGRAGRIRVLASRTVAGFAGLVSQPCLLPVSTGW